MQYQYRYRGNTFIKFLNGYLIVRVFSKEYRFPEGKFDEKLLNEIIQYTSSENNIHDLFEKYDESKQEILKKHIYLLEKLGSIGKVPSFYKFNKESLYLFRNYDDFLDIQEKEKLPYYPNIDEDSEFIGSGIYSTSTYLENVIMIIRNQYEFEKFREILLNKTKNIAKVPYLKKLFKLYYKVLSWDYNSIDRKFKNGFALTLNQEVKGFNILDFSERLNSYKQVSQENFTQKFEIISSIINYFIKEHTINLNYRVEKSDKFKASVSFTGYNYSEVYIEDETYLGLMEKIVEYVFEKHYLFKERKITITQENVEGKEFKFNQDFFNNTGVVVSFGRG